MVLYSYNRTFVCIPVYDHNKIQLWIWYTYEGMYGYMKA